MEALRKDERVWTYEAYCEVKNTRRYEIIDGLIITMGPAPGYVHQDISGELHYQIRRYLQDKPCRVFHAPFDVRFPEKDEDDNNSRTVLQPDLLVLCDTSKLKGTGCVGAPDLVVEIISPSSARMDMITKRSLYEKHGVGEYWIVDPADRSISVLRLENGRYSEALLATEEEPLSSALFPDLAIDLHEVFLHVPKKVSE